MSIPQAPCKGCKEPIRHTGCHDTCERYLKYKADKLVYNLQLGEIKGNLLPGQSEKAQRANMKECDSE